MDFLNLNNVTDKEGKLNTVLNWKKKEVTISLSSPFNGSNKLRVQASVTPIFWISPLEDTIIKGLNAAQLYTIPASPLTWGFNGFGKSNSSIIVWDGEGRTPPSENYINFTEEWSFIGVGFLGVQYGETTVQIKILYC